MFTLLNRLSVRNRIWGIVLILIGGIVVGCSIDVVMLRATLHQEKEDAIRQVVDAGYSVLAHYRKLEERGELSRAEAQAAVIGIVRGMRYNRDDYFWINDNQRPAHMIMHPIFPALEGQTLADEKYNCATSLRSGTSDPFVATDGKMNLTDAFSLAVAATGDGYVAYSWFKATPGGGTTAERFPKLSYIRKFAPWDWIIGSGIYIDDIDAAIQARVTQNLILLLGMSIVTLLSASLIARSITKPIRNTMQAMHDIAHDKGGLERRVPVEGRSEITELASNFNAMLDHIQARDQALLRHQEKLEEEVASRTASLREANLQLDAELKERRRQERRLQENLEKLRALNEQLANAQHQLLESEKMASIGQLAAGVAHEINNPMGFISSNLGTLKDYVDDLIEIIDAYSEADPLLASHPEIDTDIARLKELADLGFLRKDIQVLLRESREGVDRVTKIVKNLRDFSRIDSEDWAPLDVERALDGTLEIVASEIRGKAEVIREYAGVPAVECLGAQLNQVFMNLLLNAVQAIEGHGSITLRTGTAGDKIWIEVADSGRGIPPENLKRIFEPFFTTRPIGQGTGLGLSLAYSIVQKHHGKLEVSSEAGRGSCFRIELPCVQPALSAASGPAMSDTPA